MPRPTPLNDAPGEADILRARMPDADLARLVRLAGRRRLSRSAMTRELLRLAMDLAELDQGAEDTRPP